MTVPYIRFFLILSGFVLYTVCMPASASGAYSSKSYLEGFPSANAVMRNVKGANRFDTAARQMATMLILIDAVEVLSDGRNFLNKLTNAESAQLKSYRAARDVADAEGYKYDFEVCLGEVRSAGLEEALLLGNESSFPPGLQCKNLFFRLYTHYEMSRDFREGVYGRFVAEDAAEKVRAKNGYNAPAAEAVNKKSHGVAAVKAPKTARHISDNATGGMGMQKVSRQAKLYFKNYILFIRDFSPESRNAYIGLLLLVMLVSLSKRKKANAMGVHRLTMGSSIYDVNMITGGFQDGAEGPGGTGSNPILEMPSGEEHVINLDRSDIPAAPNDILTIAIGHKRGDNREHYFLFYNHNTKKFFLRDDHLKSMVTGTSWEMIFISLPLLLLPMIPYVLIRSLLFRRRMEHFSRTIRQVYAPEVEKRVALLDRLNL